MAESHLRDPCIGTRKLALLLERASGLNVNRKRVRRLRRETGLWTIACEPRTSVPNRTHGKYPYRRRDLAVTAPNQVWCSERTDVPMPHGHAFLCAVMEGNSGKAPGGAVRNTRDVSRCLAALALARKSGEVPEICNPDQGRQFSAQEGTGKLRDRGSKTRMDGKGRWRDSVFLERLWRSVKHDGIYLREYAPIAELKKGLEKWFTNDNPWRPHAALGGATPAAVPAQNPAATEPPEEQQKAA